MADKQSHIDRRLALQGTLRGLGIERHRPVQIFVTGAHARSIGGDFLQPHHGAIAPAQMRSATWPGKGTFQIQIQLSV